MQTYSHLLLTGAINGRFGHALQTQTRRLPPRALLLGSILPDIPLITLTIVAMGADAVTRALTHTPGALTRQLFRVWFFEDPWVITAYNLFHSPVLLALFMLIGLWAWRRGAGWGGWFFWLMAAAMLHTLIDIPLHVDDGPLLLFPLDWRLRFRSPLSYWDPAYFGREWSIFEHILDLMLLLYLGWRYRRVIGRKLGKGTAVSPTPSPNPAVHDDLS